MSESHKTTTLLMLDEYNSMSAFNFHILMAAERAGLNVCGASHPSGSGDGSWNEEYYVDTEALEAVGGKQALEEAARKELNLEARNT